VTLDEGRALVAGLRGRVSGLAQPTYVLDIPGGHGKAVIDGGTVEDRGNGCYSVSDFRGGTHSYPPTDNDP
jgi:lysine 2,3-aminomutase